MFTKLLKILNTRVNLNQASAFRQKNRVNFEIFKIAKKFKFVIQIIDLDLQKSTTCYVFDGKIIFACKDVMHTIKKNEEGEYSVFSKQRK